MCAVNMLRKYLGANSLKVSSYMNMRNRKYWVLQASFCRFFYLWTLFLGLLTGGTALAQTASAPANPYDPLSQDTGATGLKQMLRRLQTTARLMQTTAHPDDEDGGMLTLESRGKGDTVLLMTLTRGEGGQNRLGSNLFDVLGVLRTLELTASDRYYGVEQRFSRVADFGFSKSADETFQKWQGHDVALGDMVRVIRTFRPDVLISRFSGTERDGHGHHQASAILTKEAFRAAADPNRFPEQIKEGLVPWQAKKFYIGNVCPFMVNSCPDENYTVKLNTGKVDPLLGMEYIQFAMEGLRHQLSQGAGGWHVDPGDRFTFYKLVDSVLPPGANKSAHEQDFFDGIDTSLPELAARLGEEEKKVPWLRAELHKVADNVKLAAERSEQNPSSTAGPLFVAASELLDIERKVVKSNVGWVAKREILPIIRKKREQTDQAINLAMNVTLEAKVVSLDAAGSALPSENNALTVVSPEQKFRLVLTLHNGSKYPLQLLEASVHGITSPTYDEPLRNDKYTVKRTVKPGQSESVSFREHVPANPNYTRPYWHRTNPEEQALNTVDDDEFLTLPFPPALISNYAVYKPTNAALTTILGNAFDQSLQEKHWNNYGAEVAILAPVMVPFLDDKGKEQKRPLAVAPVFSVMLEPGEQVIPLANGHARAVKVEVTSNLTGAPDGILRLELPSGWRAEPSQQEVKLPKRGDQQHFEFKVFPSNLSEGRTEIHAVLDAGGKKYAEGYALVTREDLAAFYYFQPAIQRVSIVDVKVPKDLKVAYIMGAGDDIPTVLRQIGLNVTEILAEKLASEDLTQYGTIVLGIRAYDTQKDVAANNKKLLDYVSAGGTLVVQYNTGTGEFNSGHFTPYPAQLGRGRVSVEEAPVEILAPNDSVFHYPNEITARDFDGWVQERGLYFMDQWDAHFQPLLASHDPGEQPLKGGLLRAQYGKGTYIYTGLAFFRQLPDGVPGAVRLFVNLLSAGHEAAVSP